MHNWIPTDSLKRPITSLVPNPPQRVAQLIDSTTTTWNEELVRSVFTPFDASEILKIPLCTRRIKDFWAWHEENRGNFSVRSAYRKILRTKLSRESWLDENEGTSTVVAESKQWSAIWHIQVPSKLRVFIWRLARQSIPTREVLNHRNMATTAASPMCGALDNWRHTLFSCTMARSVWALALEHLVERMCEHQEGSAKDWIFTLHEILQNQDFVRMVVSLWAIWGARRKAIHEDIFQSPQSVHGFLNSYLAELQVLTSRTPKMPVVSMPRVSQWVAPEAGCVKVNVDAAVTRNGSFGSVGAICKDHVGAYLGALTIVFRNISDPATLEALAVREALALSDDLYVQRIHVASDCKVVVDNIKKGSSASYGAIIHEIIEYSSAFNFCKIVHEFRSSNVEAHNLAKHALSIGGGRHVWLGHPEDLPSVPVNIVTT